MPREAMTLMEAVDGEAAWMSHAAASGGEERAVRRSDGAYAEASGAATWTWRPSGRTDELGSENFPSHPLGPLSSPL